MLSNHKGLVTNYGEGGIQNGMGGQVRFYPYEEGGGGKCFGVVLSQKF